MEGCSIWRDEAYGGMKHMEGCSIWRDGGMQHMEGCSIWRDASMLWTFKIIVVLVNASSMHHNSMLKTPQTLEGYIVGANRCNPRVRNSQS